MTESPSHMVTGLVSMGAGVTVGLLLSLVIHGHTCEAMQAKEPCVEDPHCALDRRVLETCRMSNEAWAKNSEALRIGMEACVTLRDACVAVLMSKDCKQ